MQWLELVNWGDCHLICLNNKPPAYRQGIMDEGWIVCKEAWIPLEDVRVTHRLTNWVMLFNSLREGHSFRPWQFRKQEKNWADEMYRKT